MLTMELHERMDSISSNKDLAEFIEALRADLRCNPEEWENPTLESFLDAAAAWVGSMENAYRNTQRVFPSEPSWKTVGEIFLAAKIYE